MKHQLYIGLLCGIVLFSACKKDIETEPDPEPVVSTQMLPDTSSSQYQIGHWGGVYVGTYRHYHTVSYPDGRTHEWASFSRPDTFYLTAEKYTGAEWLPYYYWSLKVGADRQHVYLTQIKDRTLTYRDKEDDSEYNHERFHLLDNGERILYDLKFYSFGQPLPEWETKHFEGTRIR
ncbi:hypothetical protein KFE98_11835 [bacterium SCSIO 12741]|nr:hypothetical protein KFE98_11835 [bacterium SCSIO 12741]